MSARRKSDGVAPPQRPRLIRQRKKLHLELQLPTYEKLLKLASVGAPGKPLSLVAVVEQLVTEKKIAA